MATYLITGSSTDTGAPLYLRRDGGWTPTFAEGSALSDSTERDTLLERARDEQRECCDPYAIEVEDGPQGRLPITFKERIRATGPTIPYGD